MFARFRLPRRPVRTLVLCGGLGLTAAAAGRPSDPVPPPPEVTLVSSSVGSRPPLGEPVSPPGIEDVRLARSALAALDADPELGRLTILVSVVDRTAVVGGAVPAAAVGSRAEAVVRGVPGMAAVRNRCYVTAGPDPLARAVADQFRTPRRPRPLDLPAVVVAPKPDPEPEPKAEVAKAAPVAPAVVPGTLTGTSGSSPVTGVPVVVATRPADVLTAVGDVRKADPTRFGRLTAELNHGTLVVGGAAPSASAAWDFAAAVDKVPGVRRVVVGDVTVK